MLNCIGGPLCGEEIPDAFLKDGRLETDIRFYRHDYPDGSSGPVWEMCDSRSMAHVVYEVEGGKLLHRKTRMYD